MRTPLRRMFAGLTIASIAAACGSTGAKWEAPDGSGLTGDDAASILVGGDGSAGGGPKGCQADGDCGPGGLCDPATHACGCGGTQVQAQKAPPNLLIVMDRSCSMRALVNGTPKWTIAVQALTKLIQQYTGKVRFGLTLFPDRIGDKCTQGPIPLPVGPGNEAQIQQLLAASLTAGDPNFPDGPCVTPIDAAMMQAATDPGLADKTRGDFTLLITDGQQAGCNPMKGNQVTLQTLTTLLNQGARTFVVGFGTAVSVASLDSFAQAGGAVNASGPHMFYDASNQASLDAALGAIAQATLSCTLQLSQPPPNGDASRIFVYFDKTPPPVPRDAIHQSGWDYDPTTNAVTFYGASCDNLKTDKVKGVEVIFGCGNGFVPMPSK